MKELIQSKILWVVVVIVVIIILWQTGLIPVGEAEDDYQAVFLTNDQVYFGKLSNENSDYPVLKDIYYLRVTSQLQPVEAETTAQPAINLVKLGNELHSPKDEMRINKDHILFIEDLKPDSQVVVAIKNFQDTQ